MLLDRSHMNNGNEYHEMKKLKLLTGLCFVMFIFNSVNAQPTFPENGVADPRHGHYAFTNATIVKDATTTLNNATLVIKNGRIVAAGTGIKVPAGAVEIDCKDTKRHT